MAFPLVFSSPAQAADGGIYRQSQIPYLRSLGREEIKRRSERPRSLTGRVLELKTVDFKNAPSIQPLRIALVAPVKTKDKPGRSQRLLVDLGPVKQVDRLSIEKNDWIAIQGRVRPLGQKAVLVASKIRADGRTFEIDRSGYPPRWQLKSIPDLPYY